jgi:hypothetical protein
MGPIRSVNQPRAPQCELSAGEAAIARSVLYASLFDYPLTLAQLRQTLVESTQTPTEIRSAYEHSAALRTVIDSRDGFFFPRGRPDLIAERRRREARSREFLRRHGTFIRLVCVMPYIQMVALSGSIAHLNLDGDGDLDLCIVTKNRHVWSVTVAVVLLAKLLGCRRTVCANYVVDESALVLDQQDQFTASQLLHLRPLSGIRTYRRLLALNPFVFRIYPNAHGASVHARDTLTRPGDVMLAVKSTVEWLFSIPSLVAEALCRRAYGAYLWRRAGNWTSPDQVRLQPNCLKLHTNSHRKWVQQRFEALRLKTLGYVE